MHFSSSVRILLPRTVRCKVVTRVAFELSGVAPAAVAEEIVAAYGAAAPSAQLRFDRIATEISFGAFAHLLTEQLAGQGRLWRYMFTGFGGEGAFHAAELGLMLGGEVEDEETDTQQAWLQCYASFCKGDQPSAPGLAEPWEPYRVADRNGVFIDGYAGFWHDEIEDSSQLARLWREFFLGECGDRPNPPYACLSNA